MAAGPAPTTHVPGASSENATDREKEFFTTWLRLMERQQEVTTLSQTLQSILAQTGEASTTVQDARHQANLLSATDKTITDLVVSLNEFFFRDIVPALKRAKQVDEALPPQDQDSLTRYLTHGDEDEMMPQTFVDDMTGWGTEREQSDRQNQERANNEQVDGRESSDEVNTGVFHDMLIANSLKLTAMLAPDYMQQHAAHGQPAAAHSVAAAARTRAPSLSPSAASPRSKSKTKTCKRSRKVPPPVVTDLPARSTSGSVTSTPRTKPRTPTDEAKRKDRIGKRMAANLIAEQVLGIRTYGSAKEFCIRWQGVENPLWIARRKAPPQAKELIDVYATELRVRDNQSAANPKGKKKISRDGAAGEQQAAFYTVDHIVNHRLFNKKREYLVRWEHYDESEDTWEKAEKLRADVPEIVHTYEEQLHRNRARTEAFNSAMSELTRDAEPKSSTKKRKHGESSHEVSSDSRKRQPSVGRVQTDGERLKEKRLRIATDEENERKAVDDDSASENDYQFEMEEAELDEFSDEEFADKLNS
ncbi:Calponin homology domain-containing proteinromo [Phytophthora infestans]|uniref:Calponin homology domain-containing proteinromo n=1 Tax=Phytophthora infestans TaxID=4787 RepID=A0A833SJM2_PHYIN|nr:Calponin homology domain-containing proteinromo [Phytophthora infestans]